MKMKKIIGLLLCCVCLCTCTEDPVFEKEELALTATEYIDDVSYYSADVYCQIEANISINEVFLQYHTTRDWDKAQELEMSSTSSYPELAEFTKNLKVYHGHIADIKEDTTYYCRILTVTPGGKIVVKDSLQFTTLSLLAASVTTKEATGVSYTSATLNGEVAIAENASVSQTGFYYSLNADMSSAVKVSVSSNMGHFSKSLSDLEHNKTYYFQAYAVINGKICKGKILHFITNEYTLAEVETGDASDVLYTCATCSLRIINEGNSTITEKGIIYGTDETLEGNEVQKAIISSSANAVKLNDLIASTRYYYRAYAINRGGIAYGEIKSFMTKYMSDIYIEISEVLDISYTSAKVNLKIETSGQDVREYGIIYWEDGAENSSKKKSTTVSSWKNQDINKTISYSLSGLKAGTVYLCESYVKYIGLDGVEYNQEGWGDHFETKSYEVPTLTTNDATDIYANSAKITVTASSNGASITGRGIYYTSNSSYYLYDDPEDFESYTNIWTKKTGSSISLSNLSPNTTYHYIAYATSSAGTGYGQMKSFTTKKLTLPEVSATHEDRTSYVIFKGHTDGGGETNVTVGIVYYKLSEITSFSDPMHPPLSAGTKAVYSTSFTPSQSNNGDFTKSVYKSGLEKGQIYAFYIYCTNSLGTSIDYIVGIPID